MIDVLILLVLLSILAFQAIFVAFLASKVAKIRSQLIDFVSSPGENKPSPLATVWQVMTLELSRAIIAQFKTTLMGLQSADNKATRMVESAIQEDMLNNTAPIIGALMESFPVLKKTLRRNPALMGLAQEKIAEFFAAKAGGRPAMGSSSGNHSSEMKLGI